MNKYSPCWLLRLLLGLLLTAATPGLRAQPLTFDRALTCASGDGPYNWGPVAQAFDAGGNLYVAGSFNGSITLGNTLLSATQVSPNYNFASDNFLAKLDPAGNYVWAIQFGDNQISYVTDLAVDGAGNVDVLGSFDSFNLRLGGSSPVLYNSGAGSEAFVAQFSGATGQVQWARRAGGLGNDYGTKLALNGAGDVYAVFQVSSATADFGPTALTNTSTGFGASFLTKLTSGGTWQWARPVGQGAGSVTGLQLDAQGGIYLAGSFRNALTIGSAQLTSQPITGTGWYWGGDVFVAKTTDAGGWLWAVQGDAVTHQNFIDGGVGMTLDGAGHVYVAGGYAYLAGRFGGIVLPNLSSRVPPYNPQAPPYPNYYYTDAFVSRLNATTGAWEWATRYGGAGQDAVSYPLVDAQGILYAFGAWLGTGYKVAQIDPTTGTWLATQALPTFGYVLLDGQNRLNLYGSIGITPTTFGTITLQPAGPNRGTGYLARLATLPLATRNSHAGPEMVIWPNPAGSGSVWVQGPVPGQAVQVLDVLGRQVGQGRMPVAGPLALPLALPAGVYVVRAGGQARQVVVQ